MKVLRDISDLRSIAGPIHLAIGVFDGLHRGHASVINTALVGAQASGGTAIVVTFDPHPIRVLAPKRAPRLLTSPPHQLLLLDRLGVPVTLVISFDQTFSTQHWQTFVDDLATAADGKLAQICVGEEWRFGANREGDVAHLQSWGETSGVTITPVPVVSSARESQKISSTTIRKAITHGDFASAARLLGRDYTVLGTVIEGRKLGRTLGFPTANLAVHNEQLPPPGVYAVRATRLSTGDTIAGVGNLGFRPTVEGANAKLMLEVHIFNFSENLYGEELEIVFVEFLRGEQQFDGIDALKTQIEIDSDRARTLLL